jgi:putative ABC transport system permease protein
MIDSLYIAWCYIRYYKLRTVILVACITLIAVLPLTLEVLLGESERLLLNRAGSTPLLVGARGSALELVMNSLYFDDEVPEAVPVQAARDVTATGLANGIPLYVRFNARGYPIVGTNLDYFDFRALRIAQGRTLVRLGECVIGAGVAEALGLAPGDSLVSSPETVFDLAGIYPLKMQVVGVLARTHTADDRAVFVDIKTAWVITGLGHGHEDLATTTDDSVILERKEGAVTANAKLLQYTEITAANRNKFHFHGDTAGYPITAVLAVPADARSSTLLRGRYVGEQAHLQIVQPRDVIDGLLQNIFRIKHIIDGVILVVGAATLLAIVLVFALSMRLRQRELDTIFKLGCSRLTVAKLLSAEVALVVVISATICLGLLQVVEYYAAGLVRVMLVG